jgi:hypothetical protein
MNVRFEGFDAFTQAGQLFEAGRVFFSQFALVSKGNMPV